MAGKGGVLVKRHTTRALGPGTPHAALLFPTKPAPREAAHLLEMVAESAHCLLPGSGLVRCIVQMVAWGEGTTSCNAMVSRDGKAGGLRHSPAIWVPMRLMCKFVVWHLVVTAAGDLLEQL